MRYVLLAAALLSMSGCRTIYLKGYSSGLNDCEEIHKLSDRAEEVWRDYGNRELDRCEQNLKACTSNELPKTK